jgi:predicted phosphodiesterase
MTKIRIAIASDLHATVDQATSMLFSLAIPESRDTIHPGAALGKLIRTEELRCDILLCPGDLTHRGVFASQQYALGKLKDYSNLLNAKFYGTIGNHDIDSRFNDSNISPTEKVRDLFEFPFIESEKNTQFWGDNFSFDTGDTYNIIVINSSSFHGISKEKDEVEHGRIDHSTVSKIKQTISKLPKKPFNIILTHHHPAPVPQNPRPDMAYMIGGADLIQALEESGLKWIVIHGHRHFPDVRNQDGSNRVLVFASGAFSGEIYQEISGSASNQFYVLELEEDPCENVTIGGIGFAWTFVMSSGWLPARLGNGLPFRFGFGFVGETSILAAKIHKKVGNRRFTWLKLIEKVPEIQFINPMQLENLKKKLKENHKLGFSYDDLGFIKEIAKIT